MTGGRDAPEGQPDPDSHQSARSFADCSRERIRCDGGAESGRDRHRVLRELRGELARHPAVRTVEGEPPDEYRDLRATLDPSWFDRPGERASLRVTWIPEPSPGPEASDRANDVWARTPIRAYYIFHYSEAGGFDCGFHCEPNPHVEGLLHYQERTDENDAYTYEPIAFDARSVTGLTWEVMDALAGRLGGSG